MTYFPKPNRLAFKIVDPRDFGAKGDGATDDTDALRAWANALGDGTILSPLRGVAQGKFIFSDEILIAPNGGGANGTVHLDFSAASLEWDGPEGISTTEIMTFNNEDNTIVRESGSFIDDGFTPERWVEIEGTQDNNLRVYVVSVTATTLTVIDSLLGKPFTDENISCTIRDRQVALRMGDGYNDNKWFYSTMEGLYLSETGTHANLTGLEIDHSDFMSIYDCVISVSGGAAPGGRSLDISGFSKQGLASANGFKAFNILTSAATEGIVIDQSNVVTIIGGKIQQHDIGIKLRRATAFNFQNIDLSLNTVNAIFCEKSGGINMQGVYAERNGPGTRGNDSKLYYFKECTGIVMGGCSLNGTNGTTTSATHPGYGVYLEGTSNVHIYGGSGKLCQRALVYADENCDDIVIEPSQSHEQGTGWYIRAFQPVIDLANAIQRPIGKALTLLPDGLSNLLPTNDLSNDGYWTVQNGASITGSISTDNGALVPIISLPDVSASVSSIEATTDNLTDIVGKTLYLRVKMRLVNFLEEDVLLRDTDLAVVVLTLQSSVAGTAQSSPIRIGRSWDWYEIEHVPVGNDQFTVNIAVRTQQEPIEIAVEDVQLLSFRGEYETRNPDYFNDLHSWYRADLAEEASSDLAEDGDPVQFWPDMGSDGYDLQQSTVDKRPLFTAESSLNNQPEITFDDINDVLVSSDPASIWKFLHDGTGCTIILVIRPTDEHFIFDTTNASTSNVGMSVDWSSPDDIRIRIGNGSGSWIFNTTSTVGVAPSSGSILTIRHGSNQSPNVDLRANGGSAALSNQNYLDTPSTDNPETTLHVGDRQSGSIGFGGGILEIIFYDRILTDEEIEKIENYALERYNL